MIVPDTLPVLPWEQRGNRAAPAGSPAANAVSAPASDSAEINAPPCRRMGAPQLHISLLPPHPHQPSWIQPLPRQRKRRSRRPSQRPPTPQRGRPLTRPTPRPPKSTPRRKKRHETPLLWLTLQRLQAQRRQPRPLRKKGRLRRPSASHRATERWRGRRCDGEEQHPRANGSGSRPTPSSPQSMGTIPIKMMGHTWTEAL